MAHNIFAFVVLAIPLTAILAGMVKRYLQFKERQLELMGDQTAERAAQYAAKTERLEQRVAVLERILTDRSTALGEEIDRLRDKPIN